jgi:hypothetical protein
MAHSGQPEDAPYFQARRVGDSVVTEGTPSVRLGHQLASSEGLPAGNWVEWAWDGDTLTVINDRFRTYPLFYVADAQRVLVSPSMDALLALDVDRSLDIDAIAAFLTVGYYLGEDTPFRAIRALPPQAHMTWGPSGLQLASHYRRRVRRSISREQALEGAGELIRAAVRRRIPAGEPYDLPISGGRDSRHLMLELLDAGHRPARGVTAHHHPHVWGGDVPFAARLCAELGVPHLAVRPGPVVAEEWRKNRRTSYCADEHAWYGPVADALNGRISHTYDGLHGGTSMAIHHFYTPRLRRLSREGRFDQLAAHLGRKQHGQPRYAPLIAPEARSAFSAERATARIRAELERFADGPEPFLEMRFWGRSTRELNLPSTLFLHAVPAVFTPFMDPEYVDFMWSVPSEHVDETFHDELMERRFPERRSIPFRERVSPRPARSFLRELNRDLLAVLRTQSDGSLVDRRALLRRAAVGALSGSDWFAWGRRSALTTYLVQLEAIVAGRGPGSLPE